MSVNLSPVAGAAAQFLDNSGNVLTGGKLYTYLAGTTTPAAAYTSSTGVTFHSNPIILDAAGRVSNGGELWLSDNVQYKFVLKDSNDVLIGTWDNLIGINSNFVSYTSQEEIQVATAGQTIFNLTTVTYVPGTNSLQVYVDGVNQYDGITYAYVETNANTVTFTTGLHVGALVKFTTSTTASAGSINASLVIYDPPYTGSVSTTAENKFAQITSPQDFGAVADGVTSDVTAFSDMDAVLRTEAAIGVIPPGDYVTTTSNNDFSRATNLFCTEASREKILVGSISVPDVDTREKPPMWVQKVVSFDAPTSFAHMVGAGLYEVVAKGSGSGSPNKGTWIGLYGNGVLNSQNVGTSGAPVTDINGSVIGVAGFAASDFLPGDGKIITGLWGYSMSPSMTSTEYTNATGSWQTVGLEINVGIRHDDPGKVNFLGGTKGGTAGIYQVNYQEIGEPRKHWSFGMVLHGTQINGNNLDPDPTTWSGFHVGIQLDKIKEVGINFSSNAILTTSVGIQFPTTTSSAQGYKTAIALGNNKLNLGQYFRAASDPYDLWHNGEQIFWKMGDNIVAKIPILLGYFPSTGFLQTNKLEIRVGNKVLRVPCEIRDY